MKKLMRTSLTLIARTQLILMLWCSALEILNKGIVARLFRLAPHIHSAVDMVFLKLTFRGRLKEKK